MISVKTSYVSCGVRQIFRLSDIYDVQPGPLNALERSCYILYFMMRAWTDSNGDTLDGGLCLFSDNYINGRGIELANVIRQNRLGRIEGIDITRNPNSGNNIGVWIYVLNKDAIKRFIKENNVVIPEEWHELCVIEWDRMLE